jgi:hypothetical protein
MSHSYWDVREACLRMRGGKLRGFYFFRARGRLDETDIELKNKGGIIMKRILAAFLIVAACFCGTASAMDFQDGGFGLGVLLGEPTGVSFKKWFDKTIAIDGAVGWSFYRKDSLELHTDLLFHTYGLIPVEKGSFPLYYGFGARIKAGDDDRVGIRFPVGLDYLFAKEPFDVFIEFVPVLDLSSSTSLTLNAGVGVRYYF